ncbi:MAG: hypothetical protein K2K55_01425 [Duncaniella sp.]|nr:hypothetical protein [Duncaniella sp.]
MKKTLLSLAAVAAFAVAANAQTVESWSVATPEGELKPEYVANPDESKASVVEFATASVTGTHVSGPNDGFVDAKEIPLQPKYNNTWSNLNTKALSADGSVAPFYYVQGKGNPVNLEKIKWEEVSKDGVFENYRADWTDTYYQPDGSAGLPANGTYVTVKASVDGSMKVNVWINKGSRDIYVVKASDAKALAMGTDVKISGYINGTNNEVEEGSPLAGYPAFQENIETKGTEGADAYVVGAGNQASWVYLTFNVVANETYYVFNKNTQVGFGGFEFTSTGSSAISSITADENAPVEYFNLQGIRVDNPENGLYIRRQGKNVSKVVL